MPRETFRVTAPIPALGLEPGDILVVEPGAPCPVLVCKAVDASPGALALARLSGALSALPPEEGPAPTRHAEHAPAGHHALTTGFSARVRSRMAALGITQAELAQRVGVARSCISAWTRGSMPRTPRLPALADALETSVDWLVVGRDRAVEPPLRLVR